MWYLLDNSGYYLGLSSETPFSEDKNQTNVPISGNFVKFKFDGENWVEGATAEQISQLKKSMVPLTVSRRQLRLALAFAQFDLSQIDQQINQLPEPNRTFALIAWNDAVVFERNDALLNQLAAQLGLNEEALDDLFINAGKL